MSLNPVPASVAAKFLNRRHALAVGALAVAACVGAAPAALSAQTVSFAGTQTTVPVSGLNNAGGVAVDGAGNVYVADNVENEVVKVTPSGVQTTVPASGLSGPDGVAVDRAGNVYIADFYNNRVVKVTPSGLQTTVGSGLNEPFGVAVDGAGNVFIVDNGNNRVVKVAPSGVQTTVPANGLSRPTFVAVDGAGDVFIADTLNNRVVEVKPSGVQTTVGSGLSGPYGVAVDGAGNVFIADQFNNRVVKVTPGGVQTTVPVSGLSSPFGVAVDGAGNLFITDNNTTRVVEVQTQAVNFGSVNVCAAGQATPAPCSQTLTLSYDVTASGTLGTPQVLTHGAPNLDYTLAGGSTCTGSVSAGSTCTVNVTFAPKFAGARNGAVELVDGSGNVLATTFIHGTGDGPQIAFGPGVQTTVPASGLNQPFGVAVDGAGDVFIADAFNNRVVKVTPGGVQTVIASGLAQPYGVAVDGAGDVFIADTNNNRVLKVTPGSVQTTVPTSGLNQPFGVAVDGAGDVFIADNGNNRVVEVTPGGVQTTVPASGLNAPVGVAVDGAGDLFIADTNNSRVVEVTPGGVQTTVPASGLNSPYGVAVDGAGDLFIADTFNSRVVELTPGGVQTTVLASVFPSGVAVDGAGDVFIANKVNGQVLEVNRSTPPTLSFAATNVGSTSSDSPQSVLVENVGNATLSAIPPGLIIGANFEQVPGSGTPADCTAGFSLTPGADCDLSISFKPTTSGPISSMATLTDNSLNGNPAVQNIPLTGTGVAQSQTITFAPIPSQVQGTAVTLSATASSGLPVSFTSLTPKVCTVSGTTATLIGAGTCSIQASQAGNAQYAAATPVTQSFTVTSAANFTITAIPRAETVYRERLGGVLLQLQSVQGFNGNVRLSCSGGPAGSRCVDFPKTVRVHGTAYAFAGILFSRNTKDGTYIVTFTGVSGSLKNSTTVKFTVR